MHCAQWDDNGMIIVYVIGPPFDSNGTNKVFVFK